MTPAWVLRHSLYQVRRNDEKHRQRDRARHDVLALDAMSQRTIQLMQVALKRLEQAAEQPVYTETDIAGLGRNFMTRRALEDAIETYRFHINCFALHRVKQRLETAGVKAATVQAADCLLPDPDDSDWIFARQFLDGRTDIPEMLEELRAGERTMAEQVESSKRKDDERMARIFGGSVTTSTPAKEDAMVKLNWTAFEELSREIDSLLE